MSRTLILLTLNEIEGARQVVPTIDKQVADEIIAIDGGSTDGTVDAIAAQGLRVISQKNRGRGEAFRIAVENSHGDQIVFAQTGHDPVRQGLLNEHVLVEDHRLADPVST